jgi:tRNA(Ile)-lysidine synthase
LLRQTAEGGCPHITLLYHVSVHTLAERVLSHIRREELLRAGDRVGVAVSGGIDSVALLRLLFELRVELGIVLSVVHFNHKLRGAESDADQVFVASLAREFDLEFYVDGDDVAQHAAEERVSVETAARELRYGFFRHLLGEDREGDPQGLKPESVVTSNGTAEAVPFHESSSLRSVQQGSVTPRDVHSHSGLHLHGRARMDKVATGHTLDDQAETVLMRLIRGAGLRGLGGIHPRILVEDEDGEFSGEIVRPLLAVRRRELERYLKDIGQPWREDSTNTDERFTRNRVRKLVVPLLEKEFNPAVAENLVELAEIARGEEDYWENEVSGWLGTTVHWSEPEWARPVSSEASLVQIAGLGIAAKESIPVKIPTSRAKSAREMGHPGSDDLQSRIDSAPWLVANASVSRGWLLSEPAAVQRRLVKAVGERAGIPLEFKHVEEILRFAAADGPSGKELSLPLGWKVVREPEELAFVTPDLREQVAPQDYEYELPFPGKLIIGTAGSIIEVQRIPAGGEAGYNPDQLLDAESLPGPFRVRNWRPGDRFWPAHTKSPKKIKELLQERHVAQPERRLWPVVVSGDEIVWVRGFPVSAKFRAKAGREAILILDTPSGAELAK